MKSLAYASLILLNVLFASDSYAAAKEAVYFGAALAKAYDNYHYSVKHTATGSIFIHRPSTTTTVGNVFAGYGFTSHKGFYLGSELGTGFPVRKTRFNRFAVLSNDVMFQTDLSVEDYVTGDILPGYRLYKHVLVYTRLGIMFSHFTRLEQNITFPSAQLAGNKNRWGNRLGGGVNYQLTPHFSVEANYIYMSYQTFNHLISDIEVQFRQKLHSHYTGLSLVYSI